MSFRIRIIGAPPEEDSERELSTDERLSLEEMSMYLQDNRERMPLIKGWLVGKRKARLQRQFEQGLNAILVAKSTMPPTLGHKIACFLIPSHRQDEVLGDLDERFNNKWLAALGPRAAKWCYLWHLLRVSLVLHRVAALGAVGAFVWKIFRGG